MGDDKDSHKRQLAAIETYAKRAGYQIVLPYYDAAVSGADPIDVRRGFKIHHTLTHGPEAGRLENVIRVARASGVGR